MRLASLLLERGCTYNGDSPDAVIPTPVKELLLNKPMPQLTDKEKNDVPTVQRQSKISFISDESVGIFVAGEEE